MTALALRAELPLVKIRMTVRAPRSRFCKNFRDVARITRHVRVHAAQRVARIGVVIEFRLRSQRRPTRGGVTVLTRDS